MEGNLVAGRRCGPCTACCVVPTIDQPDIQKLPGYPCHNLSARGCEVYESRPVVCRRFHCGWRMVKWIGDALRPDMSGVMVMLNLEAAPLSGIAERTALFTLLNRAALNAQGLAEAIAASVAANVNTYLVVPTSPGFAPKRARLNEVLTDPVRRKDKTALLHVLKRVRSELLSEPMQAVVLQSHPEDPERPVRSD